MRILIAYALFASLSGLSACKNAEEDPTWVADLRPIVNANCLRCHSSPSIGGAPSDFRLDVYEDSTTLDGRIIRGAATMAPFIAARAGELGTMPPDFERSPWERDTFENWYEQSKQGGLPKLGQRPGNSLPTAVLRTELSSVDKGELELEIEIADADGDLVSGQLLIGTQIVADNLQSGRTKVTISPAILPSQDHDLIARIHDDFDSTDVNIGTLQVLHADGNSAPSFTLDTQVRDLLVSDLQSPLSVQLTVNDADGDNTLVSVSAVRRDEEVMLIDNQTPDAQGVALLSLDTTAIPDGTNWQLRISVTDSKGLSHSEESARFTISHSTTALRFSDVQPILVASCRSCHPRFGIRNMPHNFEEHADTGVNSETKGVDSLRGLIYRRVVQERNMPPGSAEVLADEWRAITDAERETLSEYLLGGSPL